MHNIDNLLLESEINELGSKLKSAMAVFTNILKEGVTDLGTPSGDLAAAFDEASKRFEAARRGFGIVNKLPKGPERSEHRKRILGNLNRLRALVDRIVKQADSEGFVANQQLAQQRGQSAGMTGGTPPPQPAHDALPRMR
jgi:hypothetical protein